VDGDELGLREGDVEGEPDGELEGDVLGLRDGDVDGDRDGD
jgi:hypothetical protein